MAIFTEDNKSQNPATPPNYNARPKLVRYYSRIDDSQLNNYGSLLGALMGINFTKSQSLASYDPKTHTIRIDKVVVSDNFEKEYKLCLAGNPDLESPEDIDNEIKKSAKEFFDSDNLEDENYIEAYFAKKEIMTKKYWDAFQAQMNREGIFNAYENVRALLEINKLLPYHIAHEFSHAEIQKFVNDLSGFGTRQIIEISMCDELRARIRELLRLFHKFSKGCEISLGEYGGYRQKYLTHIQGRKNNLALDSAEINTIIDFALERMREDLPLYARQFHHIAAETGRADTGRTDFSKLITDIFRFKINGKYISFYDLMTPKNKSKLKEIGAEAMRNHISFANKERGIAAAQRKAAHSL